MKKEDNMKQLPEEGSIPKIVRGGMQVIGGMVSSVAPFAGSFLSAAASAWSENEQSKANNFFKAWIQMIEDELKEKQQTIIEIMARLDLHDEEIVRRIESEEYKSLLKKTFREWSGAESEQKRKLIRNILTNAVATKIVTDDVIKMFLDWLKIYSELHFQVISAIYNSSGITRGGIWNKLAKPTVREDSADADLYKLLIRDLSTGGIIRQHVERDYLGNPILKHSGKQKGLSLTPKSPVSAFDKNEPYELTQLGQQFVHYAMTDLPLKLEYKAPDSV